MTTDFRTDARHTTAANLAVEVYAAVVGGAEPLSTAARVDLVTTLLADDRVADVVTGALLIDNRFWPVEDFA